jgi:hypothetical protein
MPYRIATIGTAIVIVAAFLVDRVAAAIIRRQSGTPRQKYIRRTNFGLLGAGLALALREPLLSRAGRLSVWAGHF